MGDLGDYWREHKDYQRSKGIRRSRPKRSATIVKFKKKHEAAGFRQCSEWHWQATVGGDLLDFWPSKNKWRWRGVTHHGSFDELIVAVSAALGEGQ